MATADQRFMALQWAAGLRGASSPDVAIEWMETNGLVGVEPGGGMYLTPAGEVRGDELYEQLARVPGSRRPRRRLMLGLAAIGVVLWARRR